MKVFKTNFYKGTTHNIYMTSQLTCHDVVITISISWHLKYFLKFITCFQSPTCHRGRHASNKKATQKKKKRKKHKPIYFKGPCFNEAQQEKIVSGVSMARQCLHFFTRTVTVLLQRFFKPVLIVLKYTLVIGFSSNLKKRMPFHRVSQTQSSCLIHFLYIRYSFKCIKGLPLTIKRTSARPLNKKSNIIKLHPPSIQHKSRQAINF